MRVERPWGWYETLVQGRTIWSNACLYVPGSSCLCSGIITAAKVGPWCLVQVLCSAVIALNRRALVSCSPSLAAPCIALVQTTLIC